MTVTTSPTVTVGSGLNTLALTVAERGAPAGAQFIISVDGMQIGGVQTTAADMAFGESQTFDVEGSFEPGPNAVLITYLNAHNSVLIVNSASIDGTTVQSTARQ